MSVHSDTDYLESSLFIKKEFTHAKDIQITQHLYESQPKFIKADETEIKQEPLKIDTDSEITHFVKDEIIDHENFKDEMLIDWQLENKTTGDHSFYQSLERKVKFQNLNFLCDLCNEKISDKKTLQSHCIGHLKAFENVDVTNIAEVHKNLKEYSCEICKRSSSQRYHRRQHIT